MVQLTRAEAPRVHLRIQQLNSEVVDHATDSLRDHDGLVRPSGRSWEPRFVDLFTDRFVLLVSSDNDAVMLIKDLLNAPNGRR